MEGWIEGATVRLRCRFKAITENDIRRTYLLWDRFTLISSNDVEAKVRDSSGQRVILRVVDLDYLGVPDPNDDGPAGGAALSPASRTTSQSAVLER